MIKLNRVCEKDLETLRRWRMSAHVSRYMLTDPIITPESQQEWYHQIMKQKNYYWIIRYNDKRIGYVSLTNFDTNTKGCEVGHYIGESDYLRKGISKIVEANLYDFVFEVLNLKILIFIMLKDNVIAQKLHQSLGAISYELEIKNCIKNNQSYELIGQCMTKEIWFSIRDQLNYPKIKIED